MEMRLTIKRRAGGYQDMDMKRKCNGSKPNELNMFSVWLGKKNEVGGGGGKAEIG